MILFKVSFLNSKAFFYNARFFKDFPVEFKSSINLNMLGLFIYTEHQWKFTNDTRTLNKGALLVLSEQRTAVTSALILMVHRPMYRYYRKWYSSYTNAWHPFINEHQLFPMVCIEKCKVVVLPDNLSLAFSIWWNNRNHLDGVFEKMWRRRFNKRDFIAVFCHIYYTIISVYRSPKLNISA